MMALKDKPNLEIFRLYDDDLILRIHNEKNLRDTRNILAMYQEHLGESPPSVELSKSFLTRYSRLKPRTRYRYTQMIQAFMTWYGKPLTDVKVRIPKDLTVYIEDEDIEQLLACIDKKRSHKDNIERDRLLINTARQTEMRRAELANLCPRDIHKGKIIVRGGKGYKDRVIPPVTSLEVEIKAFLKGKSDDQPIFNLRAGSLSNRIHILAVRAGVPHIHTHSLRSNDKCITTVDKIYIFLLKLTKMIGFINFIFLMI